MTTLTTAPLNVTTDAATRIAQLGVQSEVQSMIDYACQDLSEVTRIEVNLYDRYEMGDEPCLAIEVYSSRPFDPADHTERNMDRWMISHFPPQVLQHVLMTYRLGVGNEG